MNEKERFTASIEKGIEDMKCCGNCRYKDCPIFRASEYCGMWKSDERTQEEREK